MIAIILRDSSKTWYSQYIGQALEVRDHGTNEKYLVYIDKKKPFKKNKKYLIKDDCEVLPL